MAAATDLIAAAPALSATPTQCTHIDWRKHCVLPSLYSPWNHRQVRLTLDGRCTSFRLHSPLLFSERSLKQRGTSLRASICEQAFQEGPTRALTSPSSTAPLEGSSKVGSPSKQCGKCSHWKPEVDFEKTKTTADGMHDYCRACNSALRLLRANKDLHHLAMSPEEAWEKSKSCKRCGLVKEVRDFNRDTHAKDGLNRWCRACVSLNDRQYQRHAPPTVPQQCARCGEVKPVSEFYVNSKRPGGIFKKCKRCHSAQTMEIMERRTSSDLRMPRADKRCTVCGSIKPAAAFSVDKKNSDGLQIHCRDCMRAKLQKRAAEGGSS